MIEYLVIGGGSALAGALIAYLMAKNSNSANAKIYVEQAKAKAKAIELEAEKLLKDSSIKAKELELEAKRKYDELLLRHKKEYEMKMSQLEKKDETLNTIFKEELQNITKEKDELKEQRAKIDERMGEVDELKVEYKKRLKEALEVLEKSAGLTEEEARELVLKKAEENSRADIAHIVRKYEEQAKKDAQKRANYIIAQATTRYAGEFAAERLINVVNLPDDELKGRIIGKEGRNIKALEMLLGVDIIIDDTPNAITVSHFNIYRRQVAIEVITRLVEDGRIHPSKIEEIHNKVLDEFEAKVLEEGENVILDLGDDVFTVGRPHPMIDSSLRAEYIKTVGKESAVSILLMDFVGGYGSNDDPAGSLAEAIIEAKRDDLLIVASYCGTENDPQRRSDQVKKLRDLGVELLPTAAQAARFVSEIYKKSI